MTSENLCRLCVSRCQDFKMLFDENGRENDAYLLMVKYFDSSYFNVELAMQLSVICFQCWQHIDNFNTFQQSVLKAQQKLLQNDQTATKVYIKSEPEAQHEIEMANSPINIKMEKPNVIDEIVVSDTTGEISLWKANAACEKSQENFIGKNLNNTPFQQYNNQTPNIHREESEAFAEPKLEIMDVLPSSDETDMANNPIKIENPEFIDDEIDRANDIIPITNNQTPNIHREESEAFAEPKLEIMDVLPSSDETDVSKSPIKMENPEFIDDEIDRANDIMPVSYSNALAEDDSMSELGESEENLSSDEEVSATYSEDEATKSSFSEQPTSSNALKKQKEIERLQESDEIIARWKPFLACLMCCKQCATLTILRQHFLQEHPKMEFYVLCCRRRLKERIRIEQHMKHHINPKFYQCETCGERYRCRSSLASHRRKHSFTEKRSYTQPIRKSKEKSDEFIAKWKPNLECVVCKVKQPTYTRLQEHFSEEHPLDQLYITCCGRKLSERHRVEEHIKIHMDPSAFRCDKCYKCFKTRFNLQNHIRRLHSEEKPNKPTKKKVKT